MKKLIRKFLYQPKPTGRRKKLFLMIWVVLGILFVAVDYRMGPFIQFPFLYIIPVVASTWYSGRNIGLFLAGALPVCRLWFSLMWWDIPWGPWVAVVNGIIRFLILLLFVYLTDRVSRQTRRLEEELKILEGLLSVCSFCKRIQNKQKNWEPMEQYIAKRSRAQFSHGVCADCAKREYGISIEE